MRIGIFGSSGGGAFATFHDLIVDAYPGQHNFIAVSDRPCGFETVCDVRKIPWIRIEDRENDSISKAAYEYLNFQGGVDIIILYFLRLVTSVIYSSYPTFNIHPSLLPAFSGFRPVERAWEAGVKFLGASLHQVDSSVDNGPLVAQMVMPISPSDTLERLEKYSYLQKVYLALLLVDLFEQKTVRIEEGKLISLKEYPFNDRSCPALSEGKLLDRFQALQKKEGIEVVQ